MKTSGAWRRNKTAAKKVRPAYKPKIRWELLGLSEPGADRPATSMESIRQGISAMASEGFSQDTRARIAERNSLPPRRGRQKAANGQAARRSKAE